MTKSSDLCSCKSGYLRPTGEVLAQGESVGEFSDIGGRRIFVCDKCKQRQIRIGVHVYMPVGEEVETEQQEKMKDYNFSCQNCDEPFTILLPEQTTKTSYTEVCEDDDLKHHNLQRISQCSNCEQNNTIYYCIGEHEGME
jgi:hypothetical protein